MYKNFTDSYMNKLFTAQEGHILQSQASTSVDLYSLLRLSVFFPVLVSILSSSSSSAVKFEKLDVFVSRLAMWELWVYLAPLAFGFFWVVSGYVDLLTKTETESSFHHIHRVDTCQLCLCGGDFCGINGLNRCLHG